MRAWAEMDEDRKRYTLRDQQCGKRGTARTVVNPPSIYASTSALSIWPTLTPAQRPPGSYLET